MGRPADAREIVPVEVTSTEDVIHLLRANGGRATLSRRLLLDVLFSSDRHLSAEELAAAIHAEAPEVNISTIYRNVEELQQLGVITHCHLGHGPATYQLATRAHAHFVCEECGATVEVPDEVFNGLTRVAREHYGFTLDPRHFAVLGRCQSCA